jgi:hypothetical protein
MIAAQVNLTPLRRYVLCAQLLHGSNTCQHSPTTLLFATHVDPLHIKLALHITSIIIIMLLHTTSSVNSVEQRCHPFHTFSDMLTGISQLPWQLHHWPRNTHKNRSNSTLDAFLALAHSFIQSRAAGQVPLARLKIKHAQFQTQTCSSLERDPLGLLCRKVVIHHPQHVGSGVQ